jgi:hypothetical protein
MQDIAPEVVSIADACLGGLQGRSALLIGPEERRVPYLQLLRWAKMKSVYQEDTPIRVPYLLPYVQLVISMPTLFPPGKSDPALSLLTAASIAKGCAGRRTPLLIFDITDTGSVDELAGLLPAVCLYTPEDLRRILLKAEMKAS